MSRGDRGMTDLTDTICDYCPRGLLTVEATSRNQDGDAVCDDCARCCEICGLNAQDAPGGTCLACALVHAAVASSYRRHAARPARPCLALEGAAEVFGGELGCLHGVARGHNCRICTS